VEFVRIWVAGVYTRFGALAMAFGWKSYFFYGAREWIPCVWGNDDWDGG